MNRWTLVLILVFVNIPLFRFLFGKVFSSWKEFKDAISLWFGPYYTYESSEDVPRYIREFRTVGKLFLFLLLCIFAIWLELELLLRLVA